MTQDYQLIGGVSPALEAVARERQGWQDETPEDLGAQVTRTSDFSFRARQANMRALGEQNPGPGRPAPVGNMAAYTEPSMASLQVTPPAQPAMPPSEDRMQVTW